MAFVYRGRNPEKCIVPQYCINKAQADSLEPSERESRKGTKSLARLWWDEIFTTCIGRMHIHSHRNMHPGEFRSFSAREYARAQGFPDWCVMLTCPCSLRRTIPPQPKCFAPLLLYCCCLYTLVLVVLVVLV